MPARPLNGLTLAGIAMLGIFRRLRKPPPQTAWAASVYLRGADLIIHAQNRTYNNKGWNSDPVVRANAADQRAELGAKVRSVLRASRWDAQAPDPEGKSNPVLKAAGVRSWRQLERESRLVGVVLEKDQISLYPYRATRRGEGEGFLVMDDARTTMASSCSDSELAAAVLEALQRAIAWRPAR